jgi:hypothetical protein
MRFSFGVMARVVYNDSPNIGSCYKDSRDVYDAIEYQFGHEVAVGASCWAELACVGEIYEDDEFIIEMIESI